MVKILGKNCHRNFKSIRDEKKAGSMIDEQTFTM